MLRSSNAARSGAGKDAKRRDARRLEAAASSGPLRSTPQEFHAIARRSRSVIVGKSEGGGVAATAGRARERVMARPARAPNTTPSSSELLASRLAPCTPVQAASPAANKPGRAGAAVQIGPDAAHRVMRGGTHGRGRALEIDAVRQAGLVDAGEALANEARLAVRHVEKDVRDRRWRASRARWSAILHRAARVPSGDDSAP